MYGLLQAEGWLNDRVKAVNDESFADVADLGEKMRKLQKHQAFEAELKANADKIADIIRVGQLTCTTCACILSCTKCSRV